MSAPVTVAERVFRGALGVLLGFCAYNVGLTGAAGPLARIGLDADWSLGLLAARLNPEMALLGLIVLTGPAAAIHAASADRSLVDRLHLPILPTNGRHAPAH